jgi:hypothetical protein
MESRAVSLMLAVVVNLMALLVDHNMASKMTTWLKNNIGNGVANLRSHSIICLEGRKKTTKSLNDDNSPLADICAREPHLNL